MKTSLSAAERREYQWLLRNTDKPWPPKLNSKGTTKGVHLITHGRAGTPEHNTWIGMKARCYNKSNPRYPEWGGRGIKVCKEWRSDFKAFYAYVGQKPSPRHSLDRIDNDGDYMPGNVRWATPKEQSANRPTWCHWITFRGETLNFSDWAARIGIARESLRDRINSGWSITRALTTPKTR